MGRIGLMWCRPVSSSGDKGRCGGGPGWAGMAWVGRPPGRPIGGPGGGPGWTCGGGPAGVITRGAAVAVAAFGSDGGMTTAVGSLPSAMARAGQTIAACMAASAWSDETDER
jgi:hypothetical protein